MRAIADVARTSGRWQLDVRAAFIGPHPGRLRVKAASRVTLAGVAVIRPPFIRALLACLRMLSTVLRRPTPAAVCEGVPQSSQEHRSICFAPLWLTSASSALVRLARFAALGS